METTICKLCGKEFKNIAVHIRTKHKLTREEYDMMVSDEIDMELPDEIADQVEKNQAIEAPKVSITEKERRDAILGVNMEVTEDMKVGDLLVLKGLTLQELGSLIANFKGGKPNPIQMIDQKQTIGAEKASKVAGPKNLTTGDLYVAEALVKKFGYQVSEITRDPKKTWHLFK